MADHTPEPCGCRIEWAYSDTHPPIIHYCPTHAAAPKLLAALEEIAFSGVTSDITASGGAPWYAEVARAAIAKARGIDA